MSEHLFHFLTLLFSPVKGENYLPAPVQGEGCQEEGSIK